MKKLNKNNLKTLNNMTRKHIKEGNLLLTRFNETIYSDVEQSKEFALQSPTKVELKPFRDDYSGKMSLNDIDNAIKQNKKDYQKYKEFHENKQATVDKIIYDKRFEYQRLLVSNYVKDIGKFFGMTNKQLSLFKRDIMGYLTQYSRRTLTKEIKIVRNNFIQIIAKFNGQNFKFVNKELFDAELYKFKMKDFSRVKKSQSIEKKNVTLNEYISKLSGAERELAYDKIKENYEKEMKSVKEANKDSIKAFNKELNYRKSTYKRLISLVGKYSNMSFESVDRLFKSTGVKQEFFCLNKAYNQNYLKQFKQKIKETLELYLK